MENSVEQPIVEDTVSVEAPTQEQTNEPHTQEPKSELDELINQRTGPFRVGLTLEDLKWLKNQCNSSFPFKGPNEAFLLINAYLGLDSAIKRMTSNKEETAVLIANTIEALSVMIARYEGKGVAAAQRAFGIAIALQDVIPVLKELDLKIEALQAEDAAPQSEESAS